MKKKSIVLLVMLALSVCVFADEVFKTNVVASYYADKFHGRKTSNGEIFNMYALTAAHKTLPFNTLVKVTNLDNGQSVTVRINDRGPFVKGREIDLSKAAAVQLGMIKTGTARVSLSIVDEKSSSTNSSSSLASTETKAKGWQLYADTSTHQVWDIQLGAYTQRSNAENMARKLQAAGFTNVAYQSIDNVTRVVLRNIETDNVQSYLQQLESKGFSDYFVRERKNIVVK